MEWKAIPEPRVKQQQGELKVWQFGKTRPRKAWQQKAQVWPTLTAAWACPQGAGAALGKHLATVWPSWSCQEKGVGSLKKRRSQLELAALPEEARDLVRVLTVAVRPVEQGASGASEYQHCCLKW